MANRGVERSAHATSEPLRVALIEDQQEIRKGLGLLIGGTDGFRVAGSYGSVEEALAGIARDAPDVVLTDIGLPGVSGIDGIRLLRERHPSVTFLVLSVHEDDERIFEALCAGASGYLLKSTPPARLLESLLEAAEGGSPMSPSVARRVVALFRQVRSEHADYQLTAHERRLLGMLVDGHNYKTIAGELGISVNTVAFHMKHVYQKLHVHSRAQAVARALRSGLFR